MTYQEKVDFLLWIMFGLLPVLFIILILLKKQMGLEDTPLFGSAFRLPDVCYTMRCDICGSSQCSTLTRVDEKWHCNTCLTAHKPQQGRV